MVQGALAENKGHKGVSRPTILKYIMTKYNVGQDANRGLCPQLNQNGPNNILYF
jgi:hypothetical protein